MADLDQKHVSYNVENYCVLFVDALGYRDRFNGEGLLPDMSTEEAGKTFQEKINDTVGWIDKLQTLSETLHSEILRANTTSLATQDPRYASMLEKTLHTAIKHEYWSDGILYYSPIGKSKIHCPCVGLFGLILMSGVLCHTCLAEKRPIRGAMELGWATETTSGNLLGAAPVRAYELESQHAQAPRIVLGPLLFSFLRYQSTVAPVQSVYEQMDKAMGQACLSLLKEEPDGLMAVDYLSAPFSVVDPEGYKKMSTAAYAFIVDQLQLHETDKKLKERYMYLKSYFNENGVHCQVNQGQPLT